MAILQNGILALQVCVLLLFLSLPVSSSSGDLAVNITHLRQHLTDAFNQPRSRQEPDNLEKVRDYITAQWKVSGDEEDDENDTAGKKRELITQAFQDGAHTGVNYILVVKGKRWGKPDDRPIVLGAHYDTVSDTPGVDDNGSGMAALLEVSRIITQLDQCSNSIIFVAFDLKEEDSLGSKAFISSWLRQKLKESSVKGSDFQGAIILDSLMNYDTTPNSQAISDKIIEGFKFLYGDIYNRLENGGFKGDFLTLTSRQDESALKDKIADAWSEIGSSKFRLETIELPVNGRPSESPFKEHIEPIEDQVKSDHGPFWEYADDIDPQFSPDGLKAVVLTDTAQLRGKMVQCHQAPCDNDEFITDDNLDFLAMTSKAMVKTLLGAGECPNGLSSTTPGTTASTTETDVFKHKTKVTSAASSVRMHNLASLVTTVCLFTLIGNLV